MFELMEFKICGHNIQSGKVCRTNYLGERPPMFIVADRTIESLAVTDVELRLIAKQGRH